MNGETFCVFTTQEGGTYRTINCTESEFETWKHNGFIWFMGDRDPRTELAKTIKPAFMALVRVEDNFDFVLGGSRDEPSTWHETFRPKVA